MSRKQAATKRDVLPDPRFKSVRVATMINVVMRQGKKSIAEKIVYGAMDAVVARAKKHEKRHDADANSKSKDTKKSVPVANAGSDQDALEILEKALHNIRPTVEVKSRRVGGATYQVPIEVDPERGVALAMRWVIKAAKARGEKTMILRLAAELDEAREGRGAAVKMRDDMHRMAKANQAFAHYRW